MMHIVSLSGGMSSAVAAERVIGRHGRANVVLWFADTLWEDEDLYRFLNECSERWQLPFTRHVEGRNPLQVAADEHIIPNQKIAPCSKRLKIIPFTRYLESLPKPLTVHIGMDWSEQHRMNAPRKAYEAIAGVSVDFPLMWEPIETRPYASIIEGWNIAIPRLYSLGMKHNNCGGRCVRQGKGEWLRLAAHFPARYAEVAAWERAQRAKGLPWNQYAIAKREHLGVTYPVTLDSLLVNNQMPLPEPIIDERSNCFCTFGDDE